MTAASDRIRRRRLHRALAAARRMIRSRDRWLGTHDYDHPARPRAYASYWAGLWSEASMMSLLRGDGPIGRSYP